MSHSHKVLGFLLIAVLGIYGCAKGPVGMNDRAALEAKTQRLEEDLRSTTAAKESFRLKLFAADEQRDSLQHQIDDLRAASNRERDSLRNELTLRAAERDALQSQYGTFLRSIKEQIDKAETTLSNPAGSNPPALIGAQANPAPATNADHRN